MGARPAGTRLDDRALLRRQLRAAARTLARPRAYAGAARELVLTAVHVAAYPLGVLPAVLQLGAGEETLEAPGPAPGGDRTPVVLVHGYVHNPSAFLMMASALRNAGYAHVHAVNYNPLRADIGESAELLAIEVERLAEATGESRCILIGHSMGGIVARYYTQELAPAGRVGTVITLGSPHRGTYAAHLGAGPAARQLRPRSALMRRLEEGARPSDVRWISYYSDLDFMVTPAVSAKLVHPALRATNIRLRDTGHLSLLLSGEALRSILDELTTAAGTAPGDGRTR